MLSFMSSNIGINPLAVSINRATSLNSASNTTNTGTVLVRCSGRNWFVKSTSSSLLKI